MIKVVIHKIDFEKFVKGMEAMHLAIADLVSALVVNKLLRANELEAIAKENEVSIDELIMDAFEQGLLRF